jgi:peroxiredoxin
LAEVVAISAEEPGEIQKMDQLLGGAFTLLSDPNLEAISAYQMEHRMGGATIGNMGYAIIDGNGNLRKVAVDPLFGHHADDIIASLQGI